MFFKSFSIQIRVIYALLMREIITRYGRHNIGFLWLFLEPMLFTMGILSLWTLLGLGKKGLPIAEFALSGYSTILLWRSVANRCANAIEPNLSLLFHKNVKVIDIFLARAFLEILGSTTSLITLTLIFILFDIINVPNDILMIIEGWLLLSWFSIGLGLIIGSLVHMSDTIDRFWHIITYLLFGFSGVAFMVDWLPQSVQKLVLLLPMVHSTEMIRHGYFGNIIKTYEDPLYMVYANFIVGFLGLYLVSVISKKIEH